jgi:hypothetical protein
LRVTVDGVAREGPATGVVTSTEPPAAARIPQEAALPAAERVTPAGVADMAVNSARLRYV